jgi:hypothetical protein
MADYSVALGVKPLDVATPLMQAARIRAAEAEQQQQQVKTSRDLIGTEARGLLSLYGTPDYEPARQAAAERLKQAGIFNNPMAVQGWERDTSSPIALQSLVARSTPPELAFREQESRRAQANSDRDYKERVRQFDVGQSGGNTDDIKEFRFAQKEGFEGTFADWTQRKRAGAGEYSLSPQWGEDAEGNPVMIQTGKSGVATTAKLPDGVKLRGKQMEKIDAGTEYILMDPITRQVVGRQPKNVAGAAADKKVGEGAGEAQVNLPTIESTSEAALKTVNQLRTHPGKQYAIGFEGIVPPIAGTSQRDYIAILDQAKGQTFLQAYQSLRGGGAITEAEGQKAEVALGRLARTQTKEGYDAALNDLEEVIKRGVKVAREKAKKLPGQQSQPAQATAPADPLGIR